MKLVKYINTWYVLYDPDNNTYLCSDYQHWITSVKQVAKFSTFEQAEKYIKEFY